MTDYFAWLRARYPDEAEAEIQPMLENLSETETHHPEPKAVDMDEDDVPF